MGEDDTIRSGVLYLCPQTPTSLSSAGRPKRWQRRWFRLAAGGALTYALDHYPETAPYGCVDLNDCEQVFDAAAVTGEPNSVGLRIAGRDAVFLKADTADDFRSWSDAFSKLVSLKADRSLEGQSSAGGGAVVAVDEDAVTRVAVGDAARRRSDPLGLRADGIHGRPRSVKQRRRLAKDDGPPRRAFSDVADQRQAVLAALHSPSLARCSEHSSSCNSVDLPLSADDDCDSDSTVPKADVTLHTLRKGWLMMRVKASADWQKHWVVLAGLSLRMYKDAWAEEKGEPVVHIDLAHCEKVYPISVARNYGIEIRCRRSRHILSAMTPGIRDSWVAAIQQNVSSPSPTLNSRPIASPAAAAFSDCSASPLSIALVGRRRCRPSEREWRALQRKKHIAYVAPESHLRLPTDESLSESDVDDDEHRHVDAAVSPDRSWFRSAGDSSDDAPPLPAASSRARRRSSSPTVRRSPVSRLKQRSSTRQRSPVALASTRPLSAVHSNAVGQSSSGSAHHSTPVVEAALSDEAQSEQEYRLRLLERQVVTLRRQLDDTRDRLGETESDNLKLRDQWISANELALRAAGCASPQLSDLRDSLAKAEQEIFRKQEEIELLQRRYDDVHANTQDASQQAVAPDGVGVAQSAPSSFVTAGDALVHFLQNVQSSLLAVAADIDAPVVDELNECQSRLQECRGDGAESIEAWMSNAEPIIQRLAAAVQLHMTRRACAAAQSPDDLAHEVEVLEQELCYVQTAHAEELECVRAEMQSRLASFRDKATAEEERRKRMQDEMMGMKLQRMSDHNLETLQQSHEQLLASLNASHASDMEQLRRTLQDELDDEKAATRTAIDSIRRAYDEEVRKLREQTASTPTSPVVGAQPVALSKRNAQMLEQMSRELSELSAAYSAKCLENSRLEERLSELQALLDATDLPDDVAAKMRANDDEVDALRHKLAAAEAMLLTNAAFSQSKALHMSVSPPHACGLPTAPDASEYQPRPAKERFRDSFKRRNDGRYHSSPAVESTEQSGRACMAENIFSEVQAVMGLSVSERRKVFESLV